MPASWGHPHLRGLTFSALYSPIVMFPILASLVNNLHEGIIDDIMKLLGGNSPYFNSQPFCVAPGSSFMHALDDGGLTVMCGDKRHPVGALHGTIPYLEKEFDKLSGVSYFADVYMSFILMCDGYNVENKGLTMDWNDNPAHKPDPIKTSFPILFVSNSADPVVSIGSDPPSLYCLVVLLPQNKPVISAPNPHRLLLIPPSLRLRCTLVSKWLRNLSMPVLSNSSLRDTAHSPRPQGAQMIGSRVI